MGCNRCTCTAPGSQQRALATVGAQLGMYGLRIARSSPPDIQLRGISGSSGSGKFDPTTSDAEPSAQPSDTFHKVEMPSETPLGTTPGSAPFVAGAWSYETTPATYSAQPGDTFVGLAKTYLPSNPAGIRWKEIWHMNSQTHPDPDRVNVGDKLDMPDEAAANAKKAGAKKSAPGGAVKGDGPGLLAWIVGGAVVAVAGTGIAYGVNAMAKKKRRAAA